MPKTALSRLPRLMAPLFAVLIWIGCGSDSQGDPVVPPNDVANGAEDIRDTAPDDITEIDQARDVAEVAPEDTEPDAKIDHDTLVCLDDADCSELDEPCVTFRCLDGVCVAHLWQRGSACDDENQCTEMGTCDDEGRCTPGPPIDCSDGDPCTRDDCDPDLGCLNTQRGDGASCADPARPCDGSICQSGDCAPRNRPNGTPCGTEQPCGRETCRDGECVFSPFLDGMTCDDQDPCTFDTICDDGRCVGTTVECDDGDPCTLGECDSSSGDCVYPPAPDSTPCDDGDPCTLDDECRDGVCVGGATPACEPDGDPCTKVECDPETGACSYPPTPDGTPCDDGNLCTQVDVCIDGVCVGSDLIECDDGDPCTVGECEPSTGECIFLPGHDGAACEAPSPCRLGVCSGGNCVDGAEVHCDDGNQCTDSHCDPTQDKCVHPPKTDGVACNTNPCTLDDSCQDGLCVAGTVPACPDDGNPCTQVHCDERTGACTYLNGPDGVPCDDHEPCSINSVCRSGSCVGEWNDPWCCVDDEDCIAFDACEPGHCDEGRCVYEPLQCDFPSEGCEGAFCLDGECHDATLCGPTLVWEERFDEGSGGLRAWPPPATELTGAAARAEGRGLRLRAGEVEGPMLVKGPLTFVPAGTVKLSIWVRIAAAGGLAPDGTLSLTLYSVAPGGDEVVDEALLEGPTGNFVELSVTAGDVNPLYLQFVLEYDGAVGVIDIDNPRMVHMGRDGCLRDRVRSISTGGNRASDLTLTTSPRGRALILWTEARDGAEGEELLVRNALLHPLRQQSSSRRTVSNWALRPFNWRLRGASAPDSTFLAVYPEDTLARTVEAAIVDETSPFPRDWFWLEQDQPTLWNFDAAVASIGAPQPNGWLTVWATGAHLDSATTTLRVQRFASDGAPIDSAPWGGGVPSTHRGARNVELAQLSDGRHMAVWRSRRLPGGEDDPPEAEVIVARRVFGLLATPSVGGVLHPLAEQLPADGELFPPRMTATTNGFAIAFARHMFDEGSERRIEIRRFSPTGTPLPPLEPEQQVVQRIVTGTPPTPVIAPAVDGGAIVVWRHSILGRDYIFYRRIAGDGTAYPQLGSSPAAIAGTALADLPRGTPDAVALDHEWVLIAWPASDDLVEYRLLGAGCAQGPVRCYEGQPEVCGGDRYLPLYGGCTGPDCGMTLDCIP